MSTDLLVRDYLKARRTLARRTTRDLAGAAERFVITGHALNAETVPSLDERADLAGLKPGMVADSTGSVLQIWLDGRRWRDRLPIDDLVDAALVELDARRRAMH
ncbi:hypothetical protein [Thiocapsa sp.]|uniref:hypothetical protein n=1 Tax=Thiocapsa sp. TaxID=2024551 RepID=UPI0035941F60